MGEMQGAVGMLVRPPVRQRSQGRFPGRDLMRHEGGVAVRSCGVREEQLGCARQKEGP